MCDACYAETATATNSKENTVTTVNAANTVVSAAPTAKKETVKIEKVQTVTVDETRFTLSLTKVQAGYLIDVIRSYITGEIRTLLLPAATALTNAGATREYANNNNKKSLYSDGYMKPVAVLDFVDDYDRERAGVKAKSPVAF